MRTELDPRTSNVPLQYLCCRGNARRTMMTTIEIKTSQIRLHARPKNKNEAIEQVGQLLVDSGNIEAGYITSMKNHEKVANTYLGHGITIPYGLPENREMIRHTGVAILQVPDGVTWNPSET